MCKCKHAILGIVISLFSFLVSITIIEGIARVYEIINLPPQTHFAFRATQPLPYKNSPYYSTEFIEESFKQPGGWLYPSGTRLILPQNFKGKYFNVLNNERLTVEQPGKFENTVYIIGGSTVYCSEVPDDYTIPSQLQTLFNQKYANRYLVRNLGTTTVASTQELERLKTLTLKPDDIIIFYDGVNDIYQGIYYAKPEETMIERNRNAYDNMPRISKFFFKTSRKLSKKSAFVRIFINPVDIFKIPKHLQNEKEIDLLLNSLRQRFKMNILSANIYTKNANAVFFHFLQPNIFTINNRSEYENTLISNYYLNPNGLEKSFSIGYSILKEVIKEISQQVKSFDISYLLNEREQGEEFYLDACHVNHKANKKIAEKIFDVVKKEIEQ